MKRGDYGDEPRFGVIFTLIALAAIVLITVIAFLPFTIIDSGNRGVITRLGKVEGVLDEGFHTINPFVNSVHEMSVRIQKVEVTADAASKDLQNVSAKVALNFHLNPKEVGRVYQEVRNDYDTVIIAPSLQEAVKQATAKYTAEELITKRELVKDNIKTSLREKLEPRGISVDEFNVTNFDFSPQFNAAIELKVKAEQDAKTAENKLKQVEAEAKQSVAKAQAEAESIRLQAQAANNAASGTNYIRLKELEVQLEFAKHWNGVYPQTYVAGGSTTAPIIPLPVGK